MQLSLRRNGFDCQATNDEERGYKRGSCLVREVEKETDLLRSLSLPLITFYGLGTILGAGIYVLIGEVVGAAGMGAPLARIRHR